MTGKVYKSAMGRPVDLGALILENENVRAVGNMGVNARGDVVDSANRVIDAKTRQVQRQYKKQATNTVDTPVISGSVSKRVQKSTVENKAQEQETQEEIKITEPAPVEEPAKPVPRGGLAAALAKSQAVKQELLKTPRQLAQEQAGVKKI